MITLFETEAEHSNAAGETIEAVTSVHPGRLVLLVDDESEWRERVADLLQDRGYRTVTAESVSNALTWLESNPVDAIVCDLIMPEQDGLAMLRSTRARWPYVPIVMLTSSRGVHAALDARRRGAAGYLAKPSRTEQLPQVADQIVVTIDCAIEDSAGRRKLAQLEQEVQDLPACGGLVGRDPSMQDLYREIKLMASADNAVLIEGESGTGKELVAKAVHRYSQRSEGTFIPLNCGAFDSPELLRAELFGVVRGAFTGASEDKPGVFLQGHRGVVLLDELEAMPTSMQVQLLRVMEDGMVQPVGGSGISYRTDVRILATTNVPARQLVTEGRLRADLYFRLNVLNLRIPPLRDRVGDIPLLFVNFLSKEARARGETSVPRVDPDVMLALVRHPWPGNVRELRNVAISAFVHCENGELRLADLPPSFSEGHRSTEDLSISYDGHLHDVVEAAVQAVEQRCITRALRETRGYVSQAADQLGISRRTLHNKMKQYEIDKESFRAASRAAAISTR